MPPQRLLHLIKGHHTIRDITLDGSNVFSELDAKQAAAKAAQDEANKLSVEIDRAWLEFNNIPGQVEKLKSSTRADLRRAITAQRG